jgi:hypothetical protein
VRRSCFHRFRAASSKVVCGRAAGQYPRLRTWQMLTAGNGWVRANSINEKDFRRRPTATSSHYGWPLRDEAICSPPACGRLRHPSRSASDWRGSYSSWNVDRWQWAAPSWRRPWGAPKDSPLNPAQRGSASRLRDLISEQLCSRKVLPLRAVSWLSFDLSLAHKVGLPKNNEVPAQCRDFNHSLR